jgi:hypothetical protein
MTMAVAKTEEPMPLTDLIATVPTPEKTARNPAAIYMAGLARTGRRAMLTAIVVAYSGRRRFLPTICPII